MATPLEEIGAFVRNRSSDDSRGRRLDLAITFAESMVRELTASVGEWEQAARALRQERDVRPACPDRAHVRAP